MANRAANATNQRLGGSRNVFHALRMLEPVDVAPLLQSPYYRALTEDANADMLTRTHKAEANLFLTLLCHKSDTVQCVDVRRKAATSRKHSWADEEHVEAMRAELVAYMESELGFNDLVENYTTEEKTFLFVVLVKTQPVLVLRHDELIAILCETPGLSGTIAQMGCVPAGAAIDSEDEMQDMEVALHTIARNLMLTASNECKQLLLQFLENDIESICVLLEDQPQFMVESAANIVEVVSAEYDAMAMGHPTCLPGGAHASFGPCSPTGRSWSMPSKSHTL
jgi:hypothetical protein